MAEYYRGNLFANTPDILNEYLVKGGRPAFRARLLLATTLLPLYGIYSGFELLENVPLREGSEEYLHSEKYEIRPRNFDAPGNINDDIKLLNALRREHRALQLYSNLSFHKSENEAILFYRKAATEPIVQWTGGDEPTPVPEEALDAIRGVKSNEPLDGDILVVVNTDPESPQWTYVHVPIDDMGIEADESYIVHDLLTGARYTWRGVRNYVRLDPAEQPGHLLLVERSPEIRAAGSLDASPAALDPHFH
jgi:starch synthase (maltosyl-transferring)